MNRDIDVWAKLRNRVDLMREAFQESLTPSPEKQQAILHERAVALASEDEPEKMEDELDLLLFSLGFETYGIETTYLGEVFTLDDFTWVPGAPAFIAGIANLRGTMLTLLDLKPFIGLQATGITDTNQVITVRDNRIQIGLLADKIFGIDRVKASELQTSPPTLTRQDADYSKGVTQSGLVVLDMRKLLRHDRLVVDQMHPRMRSNITDL